MRRLNGHAEQGHGRHPVPRNAGHERRQTDRMDEETERVCESPPHTGRFRPGQGDGVAERPARLRYCAPAGRKMSSLERLVGYEHSGVATTGFFTGELRGA